MYKDTFKIFEFGVSSGNNAAYLAKKVGSITSNYKYIATEHPSSLEQAKQTTLSQLQEKGVNVKHFEFVPQTFEDFKPLEQKADLIIASHCLAFCEKDKFYEFMQNITQSVKDGGVFMGELYLDKMGPRFMLNQSSAIQLLQGKIDSRGKYVLSQTGREQSIFAGFDVKAQVKYNGQLVHFVATKTNCKGTTFEQTDKLVDYSNKTITSISNSYSQISKGAEAQEHRGDWVNYAQIYKGLPARPLVHSIFESEQGVEWLQDRIQQSNMDLSVDAKTTKPPFVGAAVLSTETQAGQVITEEGSNTNINQTIETQNAQSDPNIVDPQAWSIYFNAQTDKHPQGDKYGRAYEDLPPSAREELESIMPKSLYPEAEEDLAPVQTLKPTATNNTDGSTN